MAVTCSAALATDADLDRALEQVCAAGGAVGADLACAFVSSAYGADAERVGAEVQRRLGPRALVGCTVQGAIGGHREVEQGPSVALFTATLPEARVETFHLTVGRGPAGFLFEGLPEAGAGDTVLLFPDPFSTPLAETLEAVGGHAPVLGGVASGASLPGENRLFRDDGVHAAGAVGVVLRGAAIRSVVSQGCRPIGRPFVVTRAEDNLVLGLAGRPPMERLGEVFEELPEKERSLARQGLHVGCAIDEYKDRHGTGDFLIRSVLGVDADRGALAVTDRVRVGQTVQFHVRDGDSAQEELRRLLERAAGEERVKGALLFACNGRGTHMYGAPHVDAKTARGALGDVALAGFFAGGELGPVAGINFVHGFTASMALFCEGREDD